MRNFAQIIRAKARQYKNQEDGATAVEFAMLVIPFCMLIFAVLELGILFFMSATLNHALSDTAREIRTGEFQKACKTAVNFKTDMCAKMKGGSKCTSQMRVDVKTSASGEFEPNMLPTIPTPPPASAPPPNPNVPPPIEPDDVDTNTAGRAPVIVRAQYYYQLQLPSTLTRLSNTTGNVRIIEAVTAFRNEPFPAGC